MPLPLPWERRLRVDFRSLSMFKFQLCRPGWSFAETRHCRRWEKPGFVPSAQPTALNARDFLQDVGAVEMVGHLTNGIILQAGIDQMGEVAYDVFKRIAQTGRAAFQSPNAGSLVRQSAPSARTFHVVLDHPVKRNVIAAIPHHPRLRERKSPRRRRHRSIRRFAVRRRRLVPRATCRHRAAA